MKENSRISCTQIPKISCSKMGIVEVEMSIKIKGSYKCETGTCASDLLQLSNEGHIDPTKCSLKLLNGVVVGR